MLLRTALLTLALGVQAQEAPPLPSVESVLQALEARQTAGEPLQQSYSYLERSTVRMLDSKGKLQEEETKEYEVTPTSVHPIRRLLKVNGKPLSEKEAAKEDVRVMKESQKAGEEEAKGGKQIGMTTLMKVWEVTGMRRAQRNGASVLVLAFHPKANVKTKGKDEELASKLEGTLTLDEATKDAVCLEARLIKSVSFYGFVGSLAEGSAFSQEFQRVKGEVTMPARLKAKLQARVLFSHVNVEQESEWFNFQKFGMDPGKPTDVHVLPKAP